MPIVRQQASITVRTDADAPFDIVATDLVTVVDDPASAVGHLVLSEGPLRPGFRWQQTVHHNRKLCHSDWVVTAVERGSVLASDRRHTCAVAGRVTEGGERWEFERFDPSLTVVRLHTWDIERDPLRWLVKRFGSGWRHSRQLSLYRRLNFVQHRAEHARAQS